MSCDLIQYVDSMLIDEKRKHVITKIKNNKKGETEIQQSDHHLIVTRMKIKWYKSTKIRRKEIERCGSGRVRVLKSCHICFFLPSTTTLHW